MLSFCIVVDLHVTVNNIKSLSVGSWKRKNGLPLHCCRAAEHISLLPTIQTYSDLHSKFPIFPLDFKQIWSFSTNFHKYWISNFTKNPPRGGRADTFGQTDGQTDGQTWRSSLALFAYYIRVSKNGPGLKFKSWSSHSSNCEDCCVMGHKAMKCGINLPPFQRNLLPPFSVELLSTRQAMYV